MSAGHHHRYPNMLVPEQARTALHRMLTTGAGPELMRRWNKLDLDHDIVYLAGYNVQGTTRYVDRDFVRALYEPAYAEQLLGAAIDTGLSPDDTLECILRHETVEKVILDADCPIDLYDDESFVGAHDYATSAEHTLVREKGGKPWRYERGLAKIIEFCAYKPLKLVPKDYSCAPLLVDPDPNAKRVLKVLCSMGIPDALKLSKEAVGYALLGGADRCVVCRHWRAARDVDLSPCDIVDGLVRKDRLCERFSLAPSDATAYFSSWTRVPLKLVGGTFVVPVEINGTITLDFVVDSGASDVSVTADVAGTLMRTNTLGRSDFIGTQTYILADGSESPSHTFVIRSLKVGDKHIKNVKGSIAPAAGSLLLGQSFLRHFKSWSIDNMKHELLLEPL
jgi:clan AA aspartic protease (TIGR02281 family)